MKLNGAQIVVRRLMAHGVTTVFGYPGAAVLRLYDELYRCAHQIHHVLAAHEQGAAHAADGYARANGNTGVVITTSGPGATNLITGVANAYLDSVPMVVITGNVAVPLLGRDSFQEVDIIGITQPVVKHSFMVRRADELEYTLDEAFRVAASDRPGPVLVDISESVQADCCEYIGKPPAKEQIRSYPFDMERAVTAIKQSKRPYIYAGGGVISSGAETELRRLSEQLNAPVGTSMMGLTAMPGDYKLNLGMSGMHGSYAASAALAECDLLIALGVRFSDRATGDAAKYGAGKCIIHVDIDHAEMSKNVTPDIEIRGDAKNVLTRLLPLLPSKKNEAWLARIVQLKQAEQQPQSTGFNPQTVIQTISSFCEDDTVIATDVGQHQIWVTQHYKFRKPRTLLTSGGLGAMGFGLGAAIGASLADNKRRTVLFTGDGSFGMNAVELATAVSQGLPVLVVILNNNALGLPRQWQGMFFEQRYSQSTLARKTDFAALAYAFGAQGHTIESLPQLEAALAQLPDDRPTVLDCRIDIDEKVFPMIPPGGSINNIIVEG